MKEVDTVKNHLVVSGKSWDFERSPCCKDMIQHLVRRECYCSWFQPAGKGVSDQFPAIRVGERYFTLSLRIQKAMFRHVRLTKNFVNVERLPDGQLKLKIPTQLLLEKKRTATRFMVGTDDFLWCFSDAFLSSSPFVVCVFFGHDLCGPAPTCIYSYGPDRFLHR